MTVHTNIEKYTILYTIMHGPQICTINKRLVPITMIYCILSEIRNEFFDLIG